MLSAQSLYKMGAVIMLVGMGMHAVLPATKVLATVAICTYSLGEHIQLGMKSTLGLQYSKPGRSGVALGLLSSTSQIGTLAGYLVIVLVFSIFTKDQPYTVFFAIAAVLAGVSAICSMQVTGNSKTDETKRRFYFHKKYNKYYMLEMFYGARKQVFLTFGPYLLILFYGATAADISLLFAISAVGASCVPEGSVCRASGSSVVTVGAGLFPQPQSNKQRIRIKDSFFTILYSFSCVLILALLGFL